MLATVYNDHSLFAELDLSQLPALQHLDITCTDVSKKLESQSLKSLTFDKRHSLDCSEAFKDLDLPQLSKMAIQFSAGIPSKQVCISSNSSIGCTISSWLLHYCILNNSKRQPLSVHCTDEATPEALHWRQRALRARKGSALIVVTCLHWACLGGLNLIPVSILNSR